MSLSLGRIQARAQEAVQTPDAAASEATQKIEAALRELDQFMAENGEWLSEDNYQELQRLKMTLKAEEAAIQGNAGIPTSDTNGDGALTDADFVAKPEALEDGWNGHFYQNNFDADRETIAANARKYGTYAGSIEIESGSTTGIAFSMTPEMSELRAESHGRDLIVTVTFHDNHKESYVIREGSVRNDPIIIDATRAGKDGQGVNIDLSRAYRVSDGGYNSATGTVSGFYVHGSEFDDVIIGSQGDDKIVGWAGNDTINAMAGNDATWGDEFYDMAGGFQAGYGGRDTIDGGAGTDTNYGGGNIDNRYHSDNNEYNVDMENNLNNDAGSIPADDAWLTDGTRGWEAHEEDGMMVMRRTSRGDDDGVDANGKIEIDMSQMEGYNMAFAEGGEDGALVITFVGENEDGSPKTFKLKIENYFDEAAAVGAHLSITGTANDDIIDFSKITNNYEFTNQTLEIHGGGGDDMIIGAEHKLQREGVTNESLWQHSAGNNPADLNRYIENDIVRDNSEEDEEPFFKAEGNNDGRIVITGRNGLEQAPEGSTLSITAPEGYTEAYISEFAGKRFVTLVKPGEPAKTIVIEMSLQFIPDESRIQINAVGEDDALGEDITPIYLGNLGEFFEANPLHSGFITLDGGTGSDLLYAQRGSNVESDRNDYVVEGDLRSPGLNDAPGREDSPDPEPEGEEPAA